MTSVTSFAPAKVNLTLHVTGQRKDGFHLLDSLVVFADVGDHLTVRNAPGRGLSLTVTGPLADGVPVGSENSVLKAAAFLEQTDLAFELEKHLPAAAGIGGGTSDAAAALRAICALRGLDMPPNVLPLGADVPVSVANAPTVMQGIGEELSPYPDLPDLWGILVNPGVDVPTGPVFKGLARKNNAPMDALPSPAGFWDWLSAQRNDLEPPARQVQPVIAQVLDRITAMDQCRLARMSGSGATCFGLFPSKDHAKSAAAALADTGWWVKATRFGTGAI